MLQIYKNVQTKVMVKIYSDFHNSVNFSLQFALFSNSFGEKSSF